MWAAGGYDTMFEVSCLRRASQWLAAWGRSQCRGEMCRCHESMEAPQSSFYRESRQRRRENEGYDLRMATVDGLGKKIGLEDVPSVGQEPRRECSLQPSGWRSGQVRASCKSGGYSRRAFVLGMYKVMCLCSWHAGGFWSWLPDSFTKFFKFQVVNPFWHLFVELAFFARGRRTECEMKLNMMADVLDH